MKNEFLPAHFQSFALRVGLHEAGHYVIARALGFRVGRLCISFLDSSGAYHGGAEVILSSNLPTTSEVADYLRRRVKVLYSGVLSEAMVNGEIDRSKALEYIQTGGADDHSKARELVQVLRSIEHGETLADEEAQEQLDKLDQELWSSAADMVAQERVTIEGIAHHLASKAIEIGVVYEVPDFELEVLPLVAKRFGG